MANCDPKTTPDAEIMAAFNDGRSCFLAGEPERLCPYAVPVLYHAWLAGWHKESFEALTQGLS
jgi:ribosome modulation factor